MTEPRQPAPRELSCDEVRDLAASFVLGALDDAEMAAVRVHLSSCADAHAEVAELGGILPVLLTNVRAVDPPEGLKQRIMAAAAADLEERRPVATAPAAPASASAPVAAEPSAPPSAADVKRGDVVSFRPRQSPWSWALGIAAVLAIALIGGWNLSLQSELGAARAYERQVAAVLDAATEPGALTAVMSAGAGDGPAGLAAVTADGRMQIAMRDLAPTGGTEVYEAWMIDGDSAPVALGGFRVGADGVGFIEAAGLPATDGLVLALTREPRPGATAPSGDPVSVGTATTAA